MSIRQSWLPLVNCRHDYSLATFAYRSMALHHLRLIYQILVILGTFAVSMMTFAQGVDVENRPIRSVKIIGMKETDPQLLLNQVRMKSGDAYSSRMVAQDIQLLTRLGRFAQVTAKVETNPDQSINLIYIVKEHKLLSDVQVVGNKHIGDAELLALVLLRAGDAQDQYLIQKAQERIRDLYRKKGYILAEVSIDEIALKDDGVLIFKVREGPKPRLHEVKFSGNKVFNDKLLKSKIQSDTYVFIFRDGEIYDEQIVKDVTSLKQYYLELGYVDVRVGREIQLSDNQQDATLIFHIYEGAQYTLDNISIEGAEFFSKDQILQAIPLKVGDIYSRDKLERSQKAIRDLYGKLAFLDTQVQLIPFQPFGQDTPKMDVTISIKEGKRYEVGQVIIRGNLDTRDKVIRRQVRRTDPGRPFDLTGIEETKSRIRSTGLFGDSRLTILGNPDDLHRDVLIEVKERQTGKVSFGAAINSDLGVLGAIDMSQSNFDLYDVPESFNELLTGKAFKGAGQFFALTIQPGDEYQNYQIRFNDPYVLDTDYFLNSSLYLRDNFRESWEEQRIGGTLGLGRNFSDSWSASVVSSFMNIDVHDDDPEVPVEVFNLKGESQLNSLGFAIERNTLDNRFNPAEGSLFSLGVHRAGALGGDYDFTKITASYTTYFALDEDFFGRKTVLRLRGQLGYIPEGADAPFFEQFHAGGRSFRGFRYRGVGPRGIRNDTATIGDDPVGGEFMVLGGIEYSYPIYSETLRGVFFMDSGTVLDDVGIGQYRVAVGFGLRISLPIFGQAPLAIDFGFPVLKEEGDETRVVSFDVALPF